MDQPEDIQEKGTRSVLEGVPTSLPSLIKAKRIQKKASRVRFDWQRRGEVGTKVQEAMQNLVDAVRQYGDDELNQDRVQEAMGDLSFVLTSYARFIAVDPDTALERANQKLIHKFQCVTQQSVRTASLIVNLL